MTLQYLLQQFIGSYLATVTAAVTLESPRKFVLKTGLIGGIGYIVHLLFMEFFHISEPSAIFIGCLVIAALAQVYARLFKAPATTFLIPSFFPFVPGSAIYQTAFYFIKGDAGQSMIYLVKTVQIGLAIALGVFIVDSIMEVNRFVRNRKKSD